MRVFHVTTVSGLSKIKNQGIKSYKSNRYPTRTKFHREIDEIGNERKENWINRERAKYVWIDPEPAFVHTLQLFSKIVEIELPANDLLCTPSSLVEKLYGKYGHEDVNLDKIVSESVKPQSVIKKEKYEAWTQRNIPPSKIVNVHDYDEFRETYL